MGSRNAYWKRESFVGNGRPDPISPPPLSLYTEPKLLSFFKSVLAQLLLASSAVFGVRLSNAAHLRTVVFVFMAWGMQGVPQAQAQTAVVNAYTGTTCAGTRFGSKLVCTANDFTVGVTFTQPAATAISSCKAGQFFNADIITAVTSNSPDRYDVGLFIGEQGNDPTQTTAANTCSLGVFPNTPFPFFESSTANTCGDYRGPGQTSTLQISGVRLLCAPAPGTNKVAVPYVLAWDNASVNTCTTSTLAPNTTAKCTGGAAAGIVDGLTVKGYLTLTKATLPTYSTQTFAFTTVAASPTDAALTTTSFSLGNNQKITVTFNLSSTGGTQTITLSEALVSGWETGAAIQCTNPTGGGTSTYITTNPASRSATFLFTGTNYGADCTFTNTKQTRIATAKTVMPSADTGTFNLSAQTDLGTLSASNQVTGGSTGFQQSTLGNAVTVTETAGANTTLTDYISAVTCINQDTSATVTTTTTLLSGNTRTATLTPASYVDTRCTFTNTRSANLSVTKTDGTTTVTAGATTTYSIVVANAGPSHANGTVLRDPVVPGLSCTSVSCSVSGGAAVCPSSPTVSSLQGTGGITLSTFPSSSSLTFALTCRVTATGQ